MSPVVARDAVAADQLVYPWPYPVGSAVEISCNAGEVAVMCPAWAVGDRLGPGRHNWQSPDPSKPVSVYFVLTGPVKVPFAMRIEFPLPALGHNVTLYARGHVLVQVADPGMLIAQFVGLPFDRVNDGLMYSCATSVERMLGKVLPRKVAMAGTTAAVCDPAAWPGLIAELSGYNPTMGAVHGVQFAGFGSLTVSTTNGNGVAAEWAAAAHESTAKGPAPKPGNPVSQVSGEIGGNSSGSGSGGIAVSSEAGGSVSGEIGGKKTPPPPPEPTVPLIPDGSRVLVALADGLMHSAIIKQAMQGYYELEIEASGDTVWVPVNMVALQ
jgi:hypothetical protein